MSDPTTLTELIRDANREITPADRHAILDLIEASNARIAQFERILDGLPQDAIDGGWTARGISAYAKQLEADLAFQKQVTDAARQNQAELLQRALETETRIADLEAQKLTEPAQVSGAVFRPGIAWETVIKAAQRNYRYRNDPATNDYPDRFTLEQIQAMDKIIPQDDREFVSLEDYRALARELAALAQQEKT
jgi:hypothetical protein